MKPPDLTFTIYGDPVQQGSKTSGVSKNGKLYTRENTAKKLKPWRAHAIEVAQKLKTTPDGIPMFPGAVTIKALFFFARPLNHFGTGRNSNILKASAPIWRESTPDGDHLDRALWDAIKQAGLVRDDAKFVSWTGEKLYGDPRVDVWLWDVADLNHVGPLPAIASALDTQEVLIP
jgi:Holliday junction resolvase RusA-like endonuclease